MRSLKLMVLEIAISTIKGIKNRIVVKILVVQRADYTLPSTLEFGACTIR